MRRIELTWLGLSTLGLLTLGCTDDAPGDDEVGDTTEGETTGTGDETSDTGDTSETSTDDATDSTDDATDSTDDATDDATDTTDETDTTGGSDFELIAAAFADDYGTLVLTFNDAVAPVDGVDPSDFRISMALTISYQYMGMSYDMSYYSDPNVYVDYEVMPIGMAGIANGPNSDQISLTLDPIFDSDACLAIMDAVNYVPPDAMAEGYFFPHYAPGDIPLTSEGGSELAAIGPDWVLEPGTDFFVDAYGWPNLDPQVPIPCR